MLNLFNKHVFSEKGGGTMCHLHYFIYCSRSYLLCNILYQNLNSLGLELLTINQMCLKYETYHKVKTRIIFVRHYKLSLIKRIFNYCTVLSLVKTVHLVFN